MGYFDKKSEETNWISRQPTQAKAVSILFIYFYDNGVVIMYCTHNEEGLIAGYVGVHNTASKNKNNSQCSVQMFRFFRPSRFHPASL